LCLLLRFATKPLARIIARLAGSIRWKFEIVIATVSLFTGLNSVGAMRSMHGELHEIQELGSSRPAEILKAVDDLEDTQHGLLFTLTPILSMLG